jgi:hypothetical protein
VLPVNIYSFHTKEVGGSEWVWNLVSDIKGNIDWRCLRTECWGEYLVQREMKWREVGEDCIMRSFITCNLRQEWSSQGG